MIVRDAMDSTVVELDAYRAGVAVWLAEHGTPSQRARWDEGLLPEPELLAAVRQRIFRPLAAFRRYARITRAAFLHHTCCVGEDIYYYAEPANSLGEGEYASICAIREAAAPLGATVVARRHVGQCQGCPGEGEVVIRHSALVSAEWLGGELSREYAL